MSCTNDAAIHRRSSVPFCPTKIMHYFELQNKNRFSAGKNPSAAKKSSELSPEDFSHTNINNTNNIWLKSLRSEYKDPANPSSPQSLFSGIFTNNRRIEQSILLFQSGKRDSDPRPQPWQGCALPTELFPRIILKCGAKIGKKNESPNFSDGEAEKTWRKSAKGLRKRGRQSSAPANTDPAEPRKTTTKTGL